MVEMVLLGNPHFLDTLWSDCFTVGWCGNWDGDSWWECEGIHIHKIIFWDETRLFGNCSTGACVYPRCFCFVLCSGHQTTQLPKKIEIASHAHWVYFMLFSFNMAAWYWLTQVCTGDHMLQLKSWICVIESYSLGLCWYNKYHRLGSELLLRCYLACCKIILFCPRPWNDSNHFAIPSWLHYFRKSKRCKSITILIL